jgi:hypothetical protein
MSMRPNGPAYSFIRNPEKVQLAEKLQGELAAQEKFEANGYTYSGNPIRGYNVIQAPRKLSDEELKSSNTALEGRRFAGQTADNVRDLIGEGKSLLLSGAQTGYGQNWLDQVNGFMNRIGDTEFTDAAAAKQELFGKVTAKIRLALQAGLKSGALEAGSSAARVFQTEMASIDAASGGKNISSAGNYALLEQLDREQEKIQVERNAADQYVNDPRHPRLDNSFENAADKWRSSTHILSPEEVRDPSLLWKPLTDAKAAVREEGAAGGAPGGAAGGGPTTTPPATATPPPPAAAAGNPGGGNQQQLPIKTGATFNPNARPGEIGNRDQGPETFGSFFTGRQPTQAERNKMALTGAIAGGGLLGPALGAGPAVAGKTAEWMTKYGLPAYIIKELLSGGSGGSE